MGVATKIDMVAYLNNKAAHMVDQLLLGEELLLGDGVHVCYKYNAFSAWTKTPLIIEKSDSTLTRHEPRILRVDRYIPISIREISAPELSALSFEAVLAECLCEFWFAIEEYCSALGCPNWVKL